MVETEPQGAATGYEDEIQIKQKAGTDSATSTSTFADCARPKEAVMHRIVLGILLLAFTPQVVFAESKAQQRSVAQATDPLATGMWAGVEKVPPGDKLLVTLKDGKKHKGRLISASDTGLTLSGKKQSKEMDRESVQQIFRLMPKSAEKATLIGAGVGFAIGTGITASVCNSSFDKGTCWGFGMLIIGGPGAAAGALAGWGVGHGMERVLIYDATVLNSLSRPSPSKKASVPSNNQYGTARRFDESQLGRRPGEFTLNPMSSH